LSSSKDKNASLVITSSNKSYKSFYEVGESKVESSSVSILSKKESYTNNREM
jgi:hypothetical protein